MEIREKLLDWAEWQRRLPMPKLEYRSPSIECRDLYPRGEGRIRHEIVMSEEELFEFDRVISELWKRFERRARILAVFYICGCNLAQTARWAHTHKDKIRLEVASAEAWLDGRMVA